MNRHAEEFARRRAAMVREQIEGAACTMRACCRRCASCRANASCAPAGSRGLRRQPLPIAAGQTISQPYIVAFMSEALQLRGGERVPRSAPAPATRRRCWGGSPRGAHGGTPRRAGRRCGGGAERTRREQRAGAHRRRHAGLAGGGAYDAIVVTAAGPEVPAALIAQLAVGGRLVMPVGEREGAQWLLRLTRASEHETRREELMGVRFVPLTGAQGWPG
jgi:protein-L-isoaspartate(D-aspartate) O-methyltransferase